MWVDRWVSATGDLLLGANCHGCGTPGWGTCPRCRRRLAQQQPFATVPDPCPPGFPTTVASAPYDRLLQRLIIAHKERQALGLSRLLGDRLAVSVSGLLRLVGHRATDAVIVLVPVPSAARAVRERGFDATLTLARLAGRRLRTRYPVRVVPALAQFGSVRDQAGLDAGQRRRNLAGGLRPRRNLDGALVVLVDDLVTSGSSLTEATRVVRSGGGTVLGAATVAATRRWVSSRAVEGRDRPAAPR
jgi:predicted amidophosphoribosyltransferase